jgi:FkbM family methyltransferase
MRSILEALPYASRLRGHASRWRTLRTIRQWTYRDQKALKFYSEFIRPGETCFDIGANRGNRTKIFEAIGARVIAVEPQSGCARLLRRAFGDKSSVTVVESACSDYQGRAQLMIAGYDGLSSLSADWISAVSATGRFGNTGWTVEADVAVTTLDSLISSYGDPTLIKIDVEGSEMNVLKGLTRTVRCLSFEFTPEYIGAALDCVSYLTTLGFQYFNFSAEESMRLTYREWLKADRIIEQLMGYERSTTFFGDIYARPDGG